MKKILLLTMLFNSLTMSSQPLTWGQAFNFDVGDVVQGVFLGGQTYRTDVVLTKIITPNNDSIIYTIEQTLYTLPSCQTCQPSSSTDTISKIVTNLNTAIPNANSTTCRPTVDTLYFANCNRRTYKISPKSVASNCMEPDTETSWYIEGVGYFYNKYKGIGHFSSSYQLVYYMKQSGPCGTAFTVYVNEQSSDLVLTKLYPNPSKGIIHIESKTELSYYNICDMTGKSCKSGLIVDKQININDLSPGIYMTQIYSSDFKVKTVKIIKE